MMDTVYRSSLFVLYQLSVAVGILAMPVALLARRAGVTLPFGRVIRALDAAYEDASDHVSAR